jgi:hypothetical protein
VPEGTHGSVVVAVDVGERRVPVRIVESDRLGHMVSAAISSPRAKRVDHNA